MFLRRQNVAQAETDRAAPSQSGEVEISSAGGIDGPDKMLADAIALCIRADWREADHAHYDWRSEFKMRLVPDPAREQLRKAKMFTNAGRQPFAPEGAPDHPGLERAETAAKLHPVIHVIDLGTDRIPPQIFGHESEDAAEPLNLPNEKGAKVERYEKHLVRVDHQRIGVIPTGFHPRAFGEQGESAAISSVDVQPKPVLDTNGRNFGNRIHAGRRGRADRGDHGQADEISACSSSRIVSRNAFVSMRNSPSLGDAPDVFFAETKRNGGLFDRAVCLI